MRLSTGTDKGLNSATTILYCLLIIPEMSILHGSIASKIHSKGALKLLVQTCKSKILESLEQHCIRTVNEIIFENVAYMQYLQLLAYLLSYVYLSELYTRLHATIFSK